MRTSNLKPRKQRPSKILAAVDGSDTSMNAANYAITLAHINNNDNMAAEVIVINVIDLPRIFKMLLLIQESSLLE